MSKVELPRRSRHGSSSRSSHNSDDDDTNHHADPIDNNKETAVAAIGIKAKPNADDDNDADASSSSSSSSSIDPVLSLSPVVTKSLRTTASQRGLALPLPKTPEREGSSGNLRSNSASSAPATAAAAGDVAPDDKAGRRSNSRNRSGSSGSNKSSSSSRSDDSSSTPLDTVELPTVADAAAAAAADEDTIDDDNDNDDDDDVPTVVLPEPEAVADAERPSAIDQVPESASSSSSSLIAAAAPNVPAPRPTIDSDDLMAASSAFQASEPGELGLVVGDLLHITSRADTGWWLGVKCGDGAKGWLPATHVRATTPDERERALAALAELKPTSKRRRKKHSAKPDDAATAAVASELAALPAPTTRSPQPPEKKTPIDRARRALNRLSRSLSAHSTDATAVSSASSPPLSASATSATTTATTSSASSASPTLVRSSDSPHPPAATASRKSELLGNIKRAIAGKFAAGDAAADIEVSEPRFQEHRSHIGMSKEGKFEWDNVPDQWKSLFTSVTRTRMGNSSRDEPRRPMTMSLDLEDLAAITATTAASGDAAAASTAAATAAPPEDAEPESRQLAETLAEARRLAALHSTDAAADDESSD